MRILTVYILCCLCTPALSQSIDSLLAAHYEIKMISSGSNRPQIRLGVENRRDILVLLHFDIALDDIRAHFDWSEKDLQRRLDLLLENDLVARAADGDYRPTSMVITLDDAIALATSARAVAVEAAAVLVPRIPELREYYDSLEAFASISFDDASLLVLSDVMLDNWQIDAIEAKFLKQERTMRHGLNYYLSLQQKSGDAAVESFGIYGNQMWSKDSLMIGIYGNRRQSARHLLSLSRDEFATAFGLGADAELAELRRSLMGDIVAYSRGIAASLNDVEMDGLRGMGLLVEDNLVIPVLSRSDYGHLHEMADLWADELVAILEANRPELKRAYAESVYGHEISFEEYLIWWYHFFYSEVTDIFVDEGHIQLPAAGVTTYIVDWN